MADVKMWHDKTLAEHEALRDAAAQLGYRFQSVSLYGTPAEPLFAAVMVYPGPAQRDYPFLDLTQLNQTTESEKAAGFAPVIVSAVGPANGAMYSVVFQSPAPDGAVLMPTLSNGSYMDSGSIQNAIATQKDTMILRWAASYGDSTTPQFAAIFQSQSSEPVMWDADGQLDSSSLYQQRFDARTSVWGRPYFVTSNASGQYFSAFSNDEVGGYWARHGIDGAELDSTYATWTTDDGYTPICLQGTGDSASSSSFAAIFVESTTPIPRSFTATGPVTNAAIDAVIEQALRTSPLRDAALAIVHGTQLVYARGYTLAEPDWPITQPTTFFRLASDSKTVAALAAYQVMEHNPHVSLDTTMQSVLNLKTPSGQAPVDARFEQVTLRDLLEHTSGLQPDDFSSGPSVVDAWKAAGHANVEMPVTRAQAESYIASEQLVSPPGMTQVYSNCGYFLIGRMLASLAGVPDAVTACQQLFEPLQITRVRNSVSLVANQYPDEARYQTYYQLEQGSTFLRDPPYPVSGVSQVSSDGLLVPDWYGNVQMEVLETAGGLSAAVTDIARLIAMVLSPNDTPAMARATIVEMMNNAVACQAKYGQRAGHGWDTCAALGGDLYHAQKGGAEDTNHSVVQVDGDWGFVVVWAGSAYTASDWYPDYPTVMDIAKTVNWTEDLFPAFGMPSL